MTTQTLLAAPTWFRACADDNTRDFWSARKDDYLRTVRGPFLELLRAAGEDPDRWRVYRPHQDVRFRPGAPPLRTFLGALSAADDGTGRYVQVDASGLLASSGLPSMAADQLGRWRAAVAGEPGERLDEVLLLARAAGATVQSGYPKPLARVPRGHPADHPRAGLLRWKGVEALRRLADVDDAPAAWLRATWDAGRGLRDWLAEHVGASELERRR